MKLSELLAGLDVQVPAGADQLEVRALSVDSRTVKPGALFAAFRGVHDDGARFVPQAVQAGAVAVLCEQPLDCAPALCVVAPEARRAFARVAARFHGDPSAELRLLGVTGTNGKTTTTYLVDQLVSALGERSGLIGTIEQRFLGQSRAATHTTPESHELQALLAEMVKARVDVVAMEVSSHALEQRRVEGCRFHGAAFTNLTRDHLDYHGTLEQYFAAKARLFRELLPRLCPAVLNLDDARCAGLAAELAAAGHRVIGFTTRGARPPLGASLLSAENLRCTLAGLQFTLYAERAAHHHGAPDPHCERLQVECPLIGAHNAENLLAALGLITGGAAAPLELLARLARDLRGAPGRLERVEDAAGRVVLVDYAHTDDALARALDAVAACRAPGARLLCVFGCGGDRDQGKRPLMGEAAGRRAGLVVATSDNPRTEDPLAILGQVEPGLLRAGSRKLTSAQARAGEDGYVVVPDRRVAIELALSAARPGDAVVIAGKGHETYQIVGQEKLPFDDRLEARMVLQRLAGLPPGGGP